MKRIFLAIALMVATIQISAQLNVQLHHDFGNDIYGSELSNRPTDGKNNRFYAIPTLADKWTF